MTKLLTFIIENYEELYQGAPVPTNSAELSPEVPASVQQPAEIPAEIISNIVDNWEELEEVADFFSNPVPENVENFDLCDVCRHPIYPSQASIGVCIHLLTWYLLEQITSESIAHTGCLKCESCGATFSGDRQVIVKYNSVLCSLCSFDFYPSCFSCKRSVTPKMSTKPS